MVEQRFSKYVIVAALVLGVAVPDRATAQSSAPETAQEAPAAWDKNAVPDGGMPRYIHPESPEERMERLGVAEDPGINPDPNREWVRFGKRMRIHRFDRQWVKYTDTPGIVRPHPSVSFTDELYQENDKWAWVWIEDTPPLPSKEEREARQLYKKHPPELIDYLRASREEFEPLEPPRSSVTLRFEESSSGLPLEGNWRNTLDVADMNGDGKADLLVPSQRGGASGRPSIFLGDGKGGWTYWDVKWPLVTDYGSAVAADFNKDGRMDAGFGIHLSGIAILYGDGKGNFTEVIQDKAFPTRRVVAVDVDRDGWTDLVALSEGPVGRGASVRNKEYTNLRAWMNPGKSGGKWVGRNLSGEKEYISGDWLATADFNGDRYPDFVGSSLYAGATHVVYTSNEAGKYAPVDAAMGKVIPLRATFEGVTAGRFTGGKVDDAVIASVRRWPSRIDPEIVTSPPLEAMAAIDLLRFSGKTPERIPIVRTKLTGPFRGLGSGDFDGDGKLDLIYTPVDPREAVILLGDGKGGFTRATVEGLDLSSLRNYDVIVRDVNGDARPDVLVMYEAEQLRSISKGNGRIQVFLNRGAAK